MKYRISKLSDSIFVMSGRKEILSAWLTNEGKATELRWVGRHTQRTRNDVIKFLKKEGYI